MNKIFVAFALTFTAASPAFAEETAPVQEAAPVQQATVASAEKKPLGIGIPESSSSPSGFAVAGTIVLAAGIAAALVFMVQKNKKLKADGDTIEVIATRQLGNKAKLMLISARGRELMLSVNDRGAKLLVEWPGREEEDKQAVAIEEPLFARDSEDEERESASAAVSGLLRLREHTSPKIPVPQSLQQAPLAQISVAQSTGRKNSEVKSYAAQMQMQPAAFPDVFQNQMRKVSR